jgi:hypothetical protein
MVVEVSDGVRTKPVHRRLFVLPLVAACAMLAGVTACDRVTETQLEPQAVRLLGEAGDPLVILIGVTWTREGWCSGQFTVTATETPTEVHVGNVISREREGGFCAGLGTADNMAWATVSLTSPLGDRPVIRDSDGARLPRSTLSGPSPFPSRGSSPTGLGQGGQDIRSL